VLVTVVHAGVGSFGMRISKVVLNVMTLVRNA
jgi:hypothetical protein